MRYRYGFLFLAISYPSQSFAQDAGSLLRDRERSNEVKVPERAPDQAPVQPVVDPTVERQGEGSILIQNVEFSGKAALLSEAQRNSLASSITGKSVGLSGIRALADAANTTLRQNGRLLAQAIIPPQDATGGTLKVEIIEGTLPEVEFGLSEDARIKRELLSGIADRHLDRQSLTEGDLESALLRMNDLPGINVRSRLAPGSSTGTSRLIIDVVEDPVLAGSLNGDNFGSPSTGRAQGHAQIALSDVTGVGDLTQLGFSLSEGQRYASASLAVPVSASGLLVTASYGFLDYENIDALGRAAGLEGRAHYGSLGFQHQAVRSRDHNLRLSAALNGKALTDDSAAGRLADKRIVSGTLGFTGDVTDNTLGGGVTQTSVSWTYGDLDLSRIPSAEFVDALGPRTQGGFHRLNADVLRLQRLPGAFSILARASGQWASKNLDSSESFSLGGPYGVRGWPVGEGRGDMGVIGSVEVRYDAPLPENLGGIQFSTFLESGRVRLNKRTFGIPQINACACNDYSLTSAGAGASWRHENFSLSGSWSHGLGRNPGRSAFDGTNADGDTGRQQVWVSGSLRF